MTDLEEFWAAPPSLLWPHGTLSSPAGRSTPLSCHLEPQGSSCAPQICRLGASCPPFLHPAAVCVSPTANADFNPAYQSLLVKLPHHFFFWLHWVFVAAHGLSLVVVSGCYSLLRCAGFSLQWLLLLRSTGSRCTGFRSCGLQALERRPSSCGARA